MDGLAEYLDKALRAAGVPISGVSIGDVADRSTWLVTPSDLQAQAQPVINGFTPPTPNTLLTDSATVETQQKALKAVAMALWECIPAPTMTKLQLQARAIAIYKTL